MKAKELQADCISGTLLVLHYPSEKNITEQVKFLTQLADVEPGGEHGTYQERADAFNNGMNQAVKLIIGGKSKNKVTTRDLVNACSQK